MRIPNGDRGKRGAITFTVRHAITEGAALLATTLMNALELALGRLAPPRIGERFPCGLPECVRRIPPRKAQCLCPLYRFPQRAFSIIVNSEAMVTQTLSK